MVQSSNPERFFKTLIDKGCLGRAQTAIQPAGNRRETGSLETAPTAVLAPVAVDRSPSPPRSWAKTAGSPQVHLSDARDRRDGLRQARV